MSDETHYGLLECQVCGKKACEHVSKLVQTQTDDLIKMRNLIETAARVAGERMTGKELTEEKVRRVADMFIREEQVIQWMTMDERAAMQLEIDYRNEQIADLKRQLSAAQKE